MHAWPSTRYWRFSEVKKQSTWLLLPLLVLKPLLLVGHRCLKPLGIAVSAVVMSAHQIIETEKY
jgi:hypothetical protein